MKKIALILCGSGYKDGSEIRESVLTLLALDQQGAHVECFAPDDWQADVVNSLTQDKTNEKRHMMVEAARIARGEVQKISKLHAKDFHGLIIPGGFGVAKNLCTFATEGIEGSVREDVKKVILDFYEMKKPIGAICIAPALVGMSLKDQGLHLTLGPVSGASLAMEKLGHQHDATTPSEWVVDKKHKVITTGAYMFEGVKLSDIFEGISGLVREVLI